MKKAMIMLSIALVASSASAVDAELPGTRSPKPSQSIWQHETLTNGFWGLNDKLADNGIELALGVTQIYQQNAARDVLPAATTSNSQPTSRSCSASKAAASIC